MQQEVKFMHKSKLKSIIIDTKVQVEVPPPSSPVVADFSPVPILSSPVEVYIPQGVLSDIELQDCCEEEVTQPVMESSLNLAPVSEAIGEPVCSVSPPPRVGPRPVEPGAVEFLGSSGCVKASQIGVIFQNEGERFQVKSFLHKSRDDLCIVDTPSDGEAVGAPPRLEGEVGVPQVPLEVLKEARNVPPSLDPVMARSDSPEDFTGSLGCRKAEAIGILLSGNKEKKRFKAFLKKEVGNSVTAPVPSSEDL
ncbi:hypothetical protein QJS10_CPB15g00909 [Acorus calamus]|uniref:Uncharacterized protein n=1 Tax=Acorus calamus TaxID=4465 RepID=A0AAV9D5W0_ACOCL|nr:hypothetical protein QJS10_CPB15g00909 [Acorus calamus]